MDRNFNVCSQEKSDLEEKEQSLGKELQSVKNELSESLTKIEIMKKSYEEDLDDLKAR